MIWRRVQESNLPDRRSRRVSIAVPCRSANSPFVDDFPFVKMESTARFERAA
jgi:hypothetical protein